jgi:hypothetical protein
VQAHLRTPPFPITPQVLRIAFFVATFLCGFGLATLPSSQEDAELQ